jgi:hypothetical protein
MYVLERVPALVKAKPELAKVAPYSTGARALEGRPRGDGEADGSGPIQAACRHVDRDVG